MAPITRATLSGAVSFGAHDLKRATAQHKKKTEIILVGRNIGSFLYYILTEYFRKGLIKIGGNKLKYLDMKRQIQKPMQLSVVCLVLTLEYRKINYIE
tara:strand:+ start:1995 stop:2288 length:294 start_codon:yes stop_codon:yes gene_type:complete